MDVRPPVRTEIPGRLHAGLEKVVARGIADDSSPFRHPPEARQGHRTPVLHHTGPHAESRRHSELRRCRAGRRAHPAVGDAEGRGKMSRAAALDFVAHGRGHPRGICPSQTAGRLQAALRGGTLPRHRRLAAGHERHTAVHPEVRATGQRGRPPVHRPRTDADTGAYRTPAARNRPLPPRTLLGTDNRLPRNDIHRPGTQRPSRQ